MNKSPAEIFGLGEGGQMRIDLYGLITGVTFVLVVVNVARLYWYY